MKIQKVVVVKILDFLKFGLVRGKGVQKPGQMCVEAVICAAMDLPHSDHPPCVGGAVRAFKIALNDCHWSSNAARAEGMKALAIAQLGSDTLDQMEFGKRVYLRGTQELLPFVFRKTAEKVKSELKQGYLDHADKCAAVTNFEEARLATKAASAAYAYAYAYAYASAASYAYAYAYASADSYAYAYASAAAFSAYAWNDELLKLTAAIGLRVLKEMESPGCKWLHLIEESA